LRPKRSTVNLDHSGKFQGGNRHDRLCYAGTNDPRKAAAFYDKIAAELGAGRFMDNDRIIAWGKPGGGAGICPALPYDGKQMTVGNGVMAAFAAKDKTQIDRLHALALSLGGSCEGPPGPRGTGGFYAAYSATPKATRSTRM
jgi:hypothetical protein